VTPSLDEHRPLVYHLVTMLSRSQNPLSQRAATPISVPQPFVIGSPNPPCWHAATLPKLRILSDPLFRGTQVFGKSEAEQSIEKQWLTEAKKTKLSNSLKTKGRVLAKIFIENEAEHFLENKRHYRELTRSEANEAEQLFENNTLNISGTE
jgi:hypothetical protein